MWSHLYCTHQNCLGDIKFHNGNGANLNLFDNLRWVFQNKGGGWRGSNHIWTYTTCQFCTKMLQTLMIKRKIWMWTKLWKLPKINCVQLGLSSFRSNMEPHWYEPMYIHTVFRIKHFLKGLTFYYCLIFLFSQYV